MLRAGELDLALSRIAEATDPGAAHRRAASDTSGALPPARPPTRRPGVGGTARDRRLTAPDHEPSRHALHGPAPRAPSPGACERRPDRGARHRRAVSSKRACQASSSARRRSLGDQSSRQRRASTHLWLEEGARGAGAAARSGRARRCLDSRRHFNHRPRRCGRRSSDLGRRSPVGLRLTGRERGRTVALYETGVIVSKTASQSRAAQPLALNLRRPMRPAGAGWVGEGVEVRAPVAQTG